MFSILKDIKQKIIKVELLRSKTPNYTIVNTQFHRILVYNSKHTIS